MSDENETTAGIPNFGRWIGLSAALAGGWFIYGWVTFQTSLLTTHAFFLTMDELYGNGPLLFRIVYPGTIFFLIVGGGLLTFAYVEVVSGFDPGDHEDTGPPEYGYNDEWERENL